MRIGLLLCDHVRDDLREVSGDYVDMYRRLFSKYEEVEVIPYDAIGGELPDGPEDCDAWVVSGSRYSVNDDEPWISDLEAFVGEIATAGIPYLGVCFGHQLLAKALGGSVTQAETGWGVGLKEVEVVPGLGLDGSYQVLNTHQDQVKTLPPGAELLGWNDDCPVALFRVGRMIGIQGHPEFDVGFSRALLQRRRGKEIPEDAADAGLATLHGTPDSERLAHWIIDQLGPEAGRKATL